MGGGRRRSRSEQREANPGEGASGVLLTNQFATLPIDVAGKPVMEQTINKNKKRKKVSTDGVSGAATATNMSDVGDFGGSIENISAAGAAKVKLPPLVVKNVHLNVLIQQLASLGVKAEYKLGRIGTKVVLRTKAEYDVVIAHLKNTKVEFFTHDIPGEKPFKAVIRGLPNFDPKVIKEELKDRYKLVPIDVFRMTRRDEKEKMYPDCLYLVHFQKGTVTLNALQAIRSINSIIVRWEKYRGGHRDVTQCQRCLNFGHGTRNCNVQPRCGTCAQQHATSDCPVEEAAAYKCANCGGAHQGSDRQCPKREDFKRIRKQASAPNPPGRRKEKPPTFRAEDFPPLRGQPNSRAHSDPQQNAAGASASQSAPSPPGFWRPSTEQANNPDLHSPDALLKIFGEMTGALSQCRTKLEQIQVLGKFIIQYGF